MTASSPDLVAFLADRGRLPAVGDDPPPWRFRGFLLPYVVALHEALPDFPDRWGYHLRQLAAGRLLEEPIPRLEFAGAGSGEVARHLDELVELASPGGGWEGLRELVAWLAWSLAVADEPPRVDEAAAERLYRTANLELLLRNPHDHLGDLISRARGSGWNPAAFYPTPHELCEAIVLATFAGLEGDGRGARTLDPCVGTGRFLLHASNFTLRLYGQDVDRLVTACCLVNGALYAPWMARPLPASYFDDAGPGAPPAVEFDAAGQARLFR